MLWADLGAHHYLPSWLFSHMMKERMSAAETCGMKAGRAPTQAELQTRKVCVEADVPDVTFLLVKSFDKCYFRCFSMVQLGWGEMNWGLHLLLTSTHHLHQHLPLSFSGCKYASVGVKQK